MARRKQTLGDFASDLIVALGGSPTKQSRDLFSAWQRWEGGWSHNAATYNPLNLTAPGSGLPTINSVGVVAIPSYQQGVQRTAKLIRSGYPTIARALASGQYNFSDPALQGDFNRWLTGKRTPGMSRYVSKIAGSLGVEVPTSPLRGPKAVPSASPASIPSAPVFDEGEMARQIMQGFLSGRGTADLTALPGIVQSSWRTPPPVPVAAAAPAADMAPGSGHQHGKVLSANGKVMRLPWQFKSTHATSGLEDEGFTQAIDIMGAPGTSVRSPGEGVVEYFHPTGAQGGGSMLIRFANGRVGWLGHVDQGLPAGTRVRAGQQLALVSADHPRPHAHWSIR